ncbi:DUF4367 domain-containing protein [Oscillibacter sp.]|uniref:DUF4367 domain-containing protein n=1 Tax=Oscillibacter sp. TaxID=1945593 RepID=UPI00289A895A|nr:DUF4367 domain-containing protein [Oscillibacter sp.]
MSDDKRALYPPLEQLSTEELEKLLLQDFVAPSGSEPDVDYIMAIMEVIQKREAETSAAECVDVDKAWNDFKENYQEKSNSFVSDNFCEPHSSDHLNQIHYKGRPPKRLRVFRITAIAAALIVILCGTVSAFGANIFQALANWTVETFGFISAGTPEDDSHMSVIPNDDPFGELRAAVLAVTDIPLVPKWAPENTEVNGDISIVERANGTRILGTYDSEDGLFSIRIQTYDNIPSEYTGVYQKDAQEVLEYESSGIVHYIMSNNSTCGAAWINEDTECFIQGSFTVEEMEKMVDSIYGE